MSNVSRRSVAKGAAWTIPAITVATSAPALAVSSTTCTDTYSCPATPMTLQAGSAPSATVAAGDGTYTNGTYIAIALGQWQVPQVTYTHSCPGQADQTITATGYYLNWGTWGGSAGASAGTGPVTNVTNRAGTAYQGVLTASTPVGASPQTAGAGLSAQANVQTSIPYTGSSCSAAQNLGTISIPFTITYLNGTTPLSTSCHYNLNLDFSSATSCSPTIGGTHTITAA